jgi:hypothetical protein
MPGSQLRMESKLLEDGGWGVMQTMVVRTKVPGYVPMGKFRGRVFLVLNSPETADIPEGFRTDEFEMQSFAAAEMGEEEVAVEHPEAVEKEKSPPQSPPLSGERMIDEVADGPVLEDPSPSLTEALVETPAEGAGTIDQGPPVPAASEEASSEPFFHTRNTINQANRSTHFRNGKARRQARDSITTKSPDKFNYFTGRQPSPQILSTTSRLPLLHNHPSRARRRSGSSHTPVVPCKAREPSRHRSTHRNPQDDKYQDRIYQLRRLSGRSGEKSVSRIRATECEVYLRAREKRGAKAYQA